MTENKNHKFTRFAQEVARRAGHPMTFGVALGFLIAWLILGPLVDYHALWIDFIGVFTGVFTFLMVFLIQNTQNRDTEAIHLKLDELIRVTKGTRKSLIGAEDYEEADLDALKVEYDALAKAAGEKRQGKAGK